MKFITTMALSLVFSATALAQSQALFEEWEGFSDPAIFDSGFIHQFDMLPLEGATQVGPKNWSGSYWSSKKGSINLRWNSEDKKGFKYVSPTKELAQTMTLEELAQLSPSEKYDLFVGRYDYPLRNYVKENTADSGAASWAGICHGWAPASHHHNEPLPKTMTNPDGIKIPFGATDIKGLLSYYYANFDDGHDGQIGLRCSFGGWLGGSKGCDEDLNAGAFHIVVANKLGLQKDGFLMDVDRYKEIWNQPVTGFKSTVVAHMNRSFGAARRTVREVRVVTELSYVNESEHDLWESTFGTAEQIIGVKKLQYRLELDAEGKIVGGAWESKERPDFLWMRPKITEFKGIMSSLPKLLND